MSLDLATDAVIAAMADAAETAVNAALLATLGENAVAETKTWPVATPAQVGANALPCLSISRQSEQEEEQDIAAKHDRVTVRIAYIAPATPSDAIDERWPLLYAAWNATIRALREGVYPQHGNSESAMSQAGVTAYVNGSARVAYQLLTGTDTVHPSFVGTAVFQTVGADLFQRDDLDNLETVATTIEEVDALAATAPVEMTVEYDWE